MQSADRAGVEDAGDDDGQDGAGLSARHRALQPRREGAAGHQPGGAAQGESLRHLGGVHQVTTSVLRKSFSILFTFGYKYKRGRLLSRICGIVLWPNLFCLLHEKLQRFPQ